MQRCFPKISVVLEAARRRRLSRRYVQVVMDWTESELFRGIDLNDSFVLGWRQENGCLVFDLEISIWPDSKHYRRPKRGEYTCYREASLVFEDIQSVQGLVPMSEAPRSTDASGETDYGTIDALVFRPFGVSLVGDFGNVEIKGGSCVLRVNT